MHDLFSLQGKVAIVTGGAGYLGSSMVEALLARGAAVAVADPVDLPESFASLQGRERLLHVRCDVAQTDSIRAALQEIHGHFGRIDILVNNVNIPGGGRGQSNELEHMTDEVWSKGVDGAVGTVFRCTRESIPYLKEHGGAIVNNASMYGMVSPDPAMYGELSKNPPNYGAGKSGVIQFTRYCAAHLAHYGIRANSVSPGPFPKPRLGYEEWFMNRLADKTMLKRTGRQHEVAGAVVFLASPAADYITGVNIPVDGGWTAW
ncbi:SDR family NAD(P)-dependent oxidoreductase [Paenibacillus cymbidii]|uniref:SDR family NAD(P)-dependent oxidoreductase n=1 Tax=Paenibacillus cymbidii TaxID=1639034 RepID=UPI001080B8FC|nr:SDR family oxidoreductase [Paenibacillus cymbidii]